MTGGSPEYALDTDDKAYRAVFENAKDALLIADDDGNYVDANPAACELLGLEKDAVLKRNIADIAGDDLDFDAVWAQFLEEGEMEGEFDLVRPDGEHRIVEFRATADVTPGRHLSALRDVTERKQMESQLGQREARFRRIAENVDEVIWMADGDADGMLYLSPSYDEFVTEPVPEVSHLRLADHLRDVHPDDRPAVRAYIETLQRDGAANDVDDEYTITYRMDGDRVYWVETSAYPVVDDGQVSRFVGLIDDITDRKEREEALASQNERLAEFAGIVSHDLRNPLQVIQARATLLREDDPTNDHAASIAETADRMEQLIEDLLTLAREGDDVTDVESTDLAAIATEAWESIEPDGATLTVDASLVIEADRCRLQQLLENLFHNAVEHAGDEPAIELGTVDGVDGPVGFFVADDGPGIAPDERERVFESGYTTRTGGTGFGLDIVEEIAEAHGWDVRAVESETGGARFEVTGVALA